MNVFDLSARLGLDTSVYEKGIESAKKGTEELSSWVVAKGQLIADALEKAGQALMNLGKSVIEIGSGFETSMAKVQTIMDTSVKGVDAMNSEMKAMSSEMGVSFSEIADTVYNAISATGDTAHAVEMAGSASKLAAAGFTDTGSALSVITTAMNAYGISAERVTDISDSLITVQNLGVTTVGELSASMGKAIAAGSAYGVNLVNLEAVYVAMTKAGISTAESTTYMSSMFKELGSAGSQVGDILQQKTGKSFGQLMGEGKSLGDVLEILWKYCKGDTEAFMNLWGSAEAGKAAMAIASQGFDEFNGTLEQIGKSSGATEKAFETMAGTFEHKAAVMKTTAQNLAYDIFNSMKDALGGIVEGVTTMLNGIGQVFNGDESGGIAMIRQGIQSISTIVAQEAPRIIGVMTEILNGIIQAIGQSAPQLIQAAQSIIMSLVQGFQQATPQIIQAAIMILQALMQGFTESAPQFAAAAAQIITMLIQGLNTAMPYLIQYVPTIIQMLTQALMQNLPMIANAVVQGASIVINTLIQNLPQILQVLGDAVWALVESIFTGKPPKMQTVMMQMGDGMSADMFNGFSTGVGRYSGQAMNGVMTTMQGYYTQFSSTAEQAGGGGGTAFGEGYGRNASQGIQSANTQVESVMQTTYSTIASTAQTAGQETGQAFGQGMQVIDSATEQTMQSVTRDFTTSCQTISTSMQGLDSTTLNHLNSMVQQFVNAANSFGSAMRSGGQQVVQALNGALQQMASSLNTQLQRMNSTITSWGQQAANSFRQIGGQMVQGLIQGIQSGQSALSSAINSMAQSAVGQAQTALQIHSPSRVFAKQVGAQIPAGIAMGIDNNAIAPMRSINALSGNMVAATGGDVAGKLNMIYNLLGEHLPNMGGDTYLDGDKISDRLMSRMDTMLGRRAMRMERGGTR